MEKLSLREFKARYGEHQATAARSVIVEDETIGKKRMIHDATHGFRVNHRITCRDKIRAPGAREKKTAAERCGARTMARWLSPWWAIFERLAGESSMLSESTVAWPVR